MREIAYLTRRSALGMIAFWLLLALLIWAIAPKGM